MDKVARTIIIVSDILILICVILFWWKLPIYAAIIATYGAYVVWKESGGFAGWCKSSNLKRDG